MNSSLEKQFQSSNNRDSFVYNKYEQEDHENPTNDARYTEAPVMVRSNTIIGDRFHANGMVVARIVKGKIYSFLKQYFSFYENKVLQLMSAAASLERIGKRIFFS